MKTIPSLRADAITQDERVAQAKKLLLDSVADQQREITGIQPPDESLKSSYETAMHELADARGGALYYPYIGSGLGHGPFVELADGSVKYDMINGIGVHLFGHSYPRFLEAQVDASLQDLTMQGHLQQNRDQAALCQTIRDAAPGMDHCFLTSSGVMANENALKMIFQKKFPADRLLAFEHCFAGRTLAVSQITDKAAYRDGLPINLKCDYLPFFDAKDPEGSTKRTLETLHTFLKRYPKQYAGMIMEPVQGEGGFYPGHRDYFHQLCSLLKEHDIAIFADEVQSFGRTPSLFAYEEFGLTEFVDVVSIGKLSQVCATLYRKEFKPRPGLLSQTFTSSTSAIRCATVVMDELLNGDFYGKNGRIQKFHQMACEKLGAVAKRHPGRITGPHGIGSMFAFQVDDGSMDTTKQFAHRLFEEGVISFICGSAPARIRFLLPVGILEERHLDEVMAVVEKCLES